MANGSVARYRWIEPELDLRLAGELGVDFLLGQILVRRGLRSREEVQAFLAPQLTHLPEPYLLDDLEQAIALTESAVADGESIAIFGDYDADGICSVAILTRALQSLGATVRTYVPHRLNDGYGLNPAAVQQIIADGAKLLVTVDCGTGDREELRTLRDAGVRTIVLDHHHVDDPDVPATAFVSTRRANSRYPFAGLAAAGIAYQFARALLGDDAARPLLPLAALATVADVVPLHHDNRVIVRLGLERFATDAPLGLRVLADEAGLDPSAITAWHCAFILGPRINAAGRMADPHLALQLLLTEDAGEAHRLARKLSDLNAERQQRTQRMIRDAERRLEGARVGPVVMLADPDWSVGLVGLLASKLAERYNRPALVFEQGPEVSRGSARSVEGFHMAEALAACDDLLLEYGGHSLAAGLTVETANLPLLEERLAQLATTAFSDGIPRPPLLLDAELHDHELTLQTMDLLEDLEPFGAGNPTPTFFIRGVRTRHVRRSRDGRHLLFDAITPGASVVRAVHFEGGHRCEDLEGLRSVDLAFTLRRDQWNGRTNLTLEVLDFRLSPGL